MLTINKLPDINQNQTAAYTAEPSLNQKSSRRNLSIDRPLADGNLSTYSKGPTPRHVQYGGLPVSLPKMSDFWRGNPLAPTQYGDSINYQTSGQ